MTDDLFDLLGTPAPKPVAAAPALPAKRPRGRPRKVIPEVLPAPPPTDPTEPFPDVSEFLRPVTTTFLATVFQTEPRRLHRKLSRCPIADTITHRGLRVPRYDFKTAVAYLVEPKLDMRLWIKSQNAASLPPHINKAFWDAENARQRWEQRAAELWHTDDVLEVFGEVAMVIKETTQLWIENLPGKEKMSTEQYAALTRNVSDLMDDLRDRLVELPKQRRTLSSITSLDARLQDQDDEALTAADLDLADEDEAA